MKTPFKLKPASGSVRTEMFLVFVLLAGLAGGGCLSRPALRQQTFAFSSPPPKPGPADGVVLSISSVSVSALFNKQSFVYRIGPESYETDPYASFLVPPCQVIAVALCGRLLGSGRFQDVIESDSRRPDKFLEVGVPELYGDFSQAGQPAAVLSVRITVFDKKSEKPVLQKDYSRRIPLHENSAAAVMAGWDKAFNEITDAITADLAPEL